MSQASGYVESSFTMLDWKKRKRKREKGRKKIIMIILVTLLTSFTEIGLTHWYIPDWHGRYWFLTNWVTLGDPISCPPQPPRKVQPKQNFHLAVKIKAKQKIKTWEKRKKFKVNWAYNQAWIKMMIEKVKTLKCLPADMHCFIFLLLFWFLHLKWIYKTVGR